MKDCYEQWRNRLLLCSRCFLNTFFFLKEGIFFLWRVLTIFFLVNMEVSCYSLSKGVTPELRFVSSSLGLVILLRL